MSGETVKILGGYDDKADVMRMLENLAENGTSELWAINAAGLTPSLFTLFERAGEAAALQFYGTLYLHPDLHTIWNHRRLFYFIDTLMRLDIVEVGSMMYKNLMTLMECYALAGEMDPEAKEIYAWCRVGAPIVSSSKA